MAHIFIAIFYFFHLKSFRGFTNSKIETWVSFATEFAKQRFENGWQMIKVENKHVLSKGLTFVAMLWHSVGKQNKNQRN